MTTMNDTMKDKPLGRRSMAALVALELALGPTAPAWAQRRGAEPEANPSFQQSLQQSGSMAGGPIGEAEPSPSSSSPSPSAAPSADDDIPPASSAQGVQIGTTQRRAPAPERVAPLDARVTVRVKGAPLATFLDTISAQAKVNFIITEGLESRRVTAFLQNVTVREALQVLLEIKGLTYQQIGKSNTYVVMPRSKSVENVITRIYALSYIPLIPLDSAKDEEKAITPQSSLDSAPGGGAGLPGGPPAAPNQGGQEAQADSPIAIINVLRSIMSKLGKVSVEPRTNSLIVTDIPEVFPQVEQIIAELDKKAPQVIIEAQIVEIDSNRTKDLGLEWGGPNGELAKFTGGQRDTTFPMSLPHDLSRTRFLDPLGTGSIMSTIGTQGSSGSGSALGNTGSNQSSNSGSIGVGSTAGTTGLTFVKTSVLDLTSLSVTLRALVSRSEARFLGKPKILTLNNKRALIQISQEQATSIAPQQSSIGGGLGTSTTKPERFNTGLVLRVTPQVNRDGYITMLVQPSFTDVQQSQISTNSSPVFDPISRAASTMVRVKNGQTLVLGGLLESTETKVVRKVPFLGYIPLIGWLFTNTSSTRRNSDLVIFLTPTVVND